MCCCKFGRAVTRGETVCLGRLMRAVLLIYVVNYRSCELFLDCDTYMYDIMELMMYLISRWIS